MTTTTGKEISAGHRLRDGREIEVAQMGWDTVLPCRLIHPVSYTVELMASNKVEPVSQILCLSEMKGSATHTQDDRIALFGLMFAGVPSVNSLSSIYSFLERRIVQADLHHIQRRL